MAKESHSIKAYPLSIFNKIPFLKYDLDNISATIKAQ